MSSPRYLWDRQRSVEIKGEGRVPDTTLTVTPLSGGSFELELERAYTRYSDACTVSIDLTLEQVRHLFNTVKKKQPVVVGEAEALPSEKVYGLSCGYWARRRTAVNRHLFKNHHSDPTIDYLDASQYDGRSLNRCKGRAET